MSVGAVSFQDLREAAVHRVLVVMKSLDLLAAKQADLQVLISHGLTSKVSPPEPTEPWGGFTNPVGAVSLTLGGWSQEPWGVSLTLLLSGAALVRGSASCDHL